MMKTMFALVVLAWTLSAAVPAPVYEGPLPQCGPDTCTDDPNHPGG